MKNANQQVKPVLAAAPSTGEGGSDPSSPSLSRQPTPHPSTMELRTAEAVDSNVGAVNNADTASADGDLLRKLQSNSLSASEFRGRLREMVKTQSETKGGSIASSSSLKGMERELVKAWSENTAAAHSPTRKCGSNLTHLSRASPPA